jgi:hypothetical protein
VGDWVRRFRQAAHPHHQPHRRRLLIAVGVAMTTGIWTALIYQLQGLINGFVLPL